MPKSEKQFPIEVKEQDPGKVEVGPTIVKANKNRRLIMPTIVKAKKKRGLIIPTIVKDNKGGVLKMRGINKIKSRNMGEGGRRRK